MFVSYSLCLFFFFFFFQAEDGIRDLIVTGVQTCALPISRGARAYRALYAVEDRPIITGEELEKATARRDQVTNQSVVDFVLSRPGGRKFERETGRHIHDYMAIILDDRVQGQPPIINGQIGQHGQIELGSKPLQDAQDLALVLRAGALPAPLTIVDESTIGPSLGQDSIRDGIRAGVVGVVLVVLIMVVYYRVSGLLAVAALTLYIAFTLAGLALLGSTLTLPGLAGLVLSGGIAVDANVLIFERIREELQHGHLVRTAVDEGFKHAMSAIIDSNVSTALTAARSEEHTSELQSRSDLVCRLLLEKKKTHRTGTTSRSITEPSAGRC